MNRIGEFNFENLLAGDFPRTTDSVVMKAGKVYPVGSVIGRETATGECALVDSTKSDGTEKVYGVLSVEVDATKGAFPGIAFLTGEYNQNRLTFGGTDTHDKHKDAARERCIFFKDAALLSDQ